MPGTCTAPKLQGNLLLLDCDQDVQMTDAFDNLGIDDLNRVLHLGHLLGVDSAS